jgi:sortase A
MSRWDRRPPPIDWRWWVGNFGRVLITVGLLMFGFVAYQLWGTAIEAARAQNSLENDFDEMLADAEPITPETTIAPAVEEPAETADDSDSAAGNSNEQQSQQAAEPPESTVPTAVPATGQNIPDITEGEALARLEIPRINTDHIVVAGVSTGDLKKGPGHYPDTPIPGQLGNAAIAGHRTTYGQPFYSINELEVGDEIIVTTLSGRYTYRVTGQEIVGPSDYQVVATTDPTVANLTLTSCHPRWTAQQRIVVYSELDTEESAPVGAPTLNYGRQLEDPETGAVAAEQDAPDVTVSGSDDPVIAGEDAPAEPADPTTPTDEQADPADPTTPTDEQAEAIAESDAAEVDTTQSEAGADVDSAATTTGTTAIADAFAEGWFSDPDAWPQVALWALTLIAIWVGGYLLARHFRRLWLGILVGFLPFLVALYFFYQNVNRLLPPNL